MTLMVVAHPIAGFTGRVAVEEFGLAFVGGFTGPLDVPANIQTQLTAAGFTLNATPGADYGPKYVTHDELEDADSAASVALRAASDARYARDAGWIVGTDDEYGAVGDWTGGTTGTDNTAAIQAGLDAAAAAGTVYYLPAGYYKVVGQINLPDYTHMLGAGWTAIAQADFGGAQWLAPTPGTYGGTVIVSTVTTGSALKGDDAVGARWTLRDFMVVGPGTGTSTGINLAETPAYTIRPNVSNVGVVNFSTCWDIGMTNEGQFDSLTAYACVNGFTFGPDFNANTVTNIEVQRATGEALVLDGVSNHFSGGIIQTCSGTRGLHVASRVGNTFDAFYLENITATQSVQFDGQVKFGGYMANNAGSIWVNASGAVLDHVYAPSATLHVADGVLGTVLLASSLAGIDAPAAQVIDIGSTDTSALAAPKITATDGGVAKWTFGYEAGKLVLRDRANTSRAAMTVFAAGSSATAGVMIDGVIMCGFSDTAGRPTATDFYPGGQWYDTTLNKPIWSNGTNWRDAAGTVV